MQPRILVVDDEESLAKLVASYLERDGYRADCVVDGEQAVRAAREQPPDLVVLDLMLPGLDGIEVCRRLRTFSDCYVIMLTARADEVDKLVGLGVGADDYVTKPFSPRELVARVRAMLRRPRTGGATPAGPDEESPREFGSLHIDVAGREVRVDGVPVELRVHAASRLPAPPTLEHVPTEPHETEVPVFPGYCTPYQLVFWILILATWTLTAECSGQSSDSSPPQRPRHGHHRRPSTRPTRRRQGARDPRGVLTHR